MAGVIAVPFREPINIPEIPAAHRRDKWWDERREHDEEGGEEDAALQYKRCERSEDTKA